jgi:hypothetical protein
VTLKDSVGGLLADGYVCRSTGTGRAWVSDVSGTELTNVSVQANYNTAAGTISLDVTQDALESISVGFTTPGKASYTYGDVFETAGLTVTAVYLSGMTKDVTASVTMNTLAV